MPRLKVEPPARIYVAPRGAVCHVAPDCCGAQLGLALARVDVRLRLCWRCRGGGTVHLRARAGVPVVVLDRPALAAAAAPGVADAAEAPAAKGVVVGLAAHRANRDMVTHARKDRTA